MLVGSKYEVQKQADTSSDVGGNFLRKERLALHESPPLRHRTIPFSSDNLSSSRFPDRCPQGGWHRAYIQSTRSRNGNQ